MLIRHFLLFVEYMKKDRIRVLKRNRGSNYLIYEFDGHRVGIVTKMLTVLGWLRYSVDHDLTLAVSMTDDSVFEGKHNIWECYYKQPMLKSNTDFQEIENIKANCNYAIAPASTRYHFSYRKNFRPVMRIFPPKILFPTVRDYKNAPDQQEIFKSLYKKYISFTPETEAYLEAEYRELLENKGKILGVRIRGTDYVQLRPFGHPIQPEVSEVVKLAGELLEQRGWDYIYLATEEKKVEDTFQREFPGRILINRREYLDGDYSNRCLYENAGSRANEFYYRELEYLSSMYLLSKCDMLIGGLCGGTQGVLFMKEGEFEYLHLFDQGDYQ